MKVLVTGATGFIGRALCQRLRDAGHGVVALSRDPAAAQRRLPELDQAFPWSLLTSEPPSEAFAGVEAVVHLAGERIHGRWTSAKKRAILDTRVLGTRNLVAGIGRLENRPAVLVSTSAIGWYGDRGDDPLTEEEPAGHDFLAGVCQQWETEATRAEDVGVRVVRLRNGFVLGRGGGFLAPQLPLYRLGLGGPLGSGRQWWSWIHVADITRLIIALLEQPIAGAVNATAPEPVHQREFAATLGRVLRRPAFLPAPRLALRLVLGEFSREVLTSRRVLPHRAQELGFRFDFPELEPAIRDALGR